MNRNKDEELGRPVLTSALAPFLRLATSWSLALAEQRMYRQTI